MKQEIDNSLSSKSLAEDLYDKVQDCRGARFSDCFEQTFNSPDFYIIGTYQAAKALAGFRTERQDDYSGTDTPVLDGTFGAIALVESYERSEFGYISSDLANPEQLASMVAYIRAERIVEYLPQLEDGSQDDCLLTPDKVKAIRCELARDYHFQEGTVQC